MSRRSSRVLDIFGHTVSNLQLLLDSLRRLFSHHTRIALQLVSFLPCLLFSIDLLISSMLTVSTGVRQASLVCGPDEARNSDPRLGLIAGLYQDGGT